MIEIANGKVFSVIPSQEPSSLVVTIQDEFTNEIQTFTDFTYNNGYLTFTYPFDTIENRQYTIEVTENETTIFKGKCIGIIFTGNPQTILVIGENTPLVINNLVLTI